MPRLVLALAALLLLCVSPLRAQKITGHVLEPTEQNLALTWQGASVVMPGWEGKLSALPAQTGEKRPLVIFMHGSSGVAPFVKEYQHFLADKLGLASIAPDSMAIPDRLNYDSPIDKPTYERVHTLRSAELGYAFEHALTLPWVDPAKIVVIGTSEGSVPVARYADPRPLARVMYAWSCEDNYFVESHRTAIPLATPVLAMIAAKDPYFSPENPWNADYHVRGTCTQALKNHQSATVVTVASDKHTIVNFPDVQAITRVFLEKVLKK